MRSCQNKGRRSAALPGQCWRVCGYWLDNLTAVTDKDTDFVQTLTGSKKQPRSAASPRQKMFGVTPPLPPTSSWHVELSARNTSLPTPCTHWCQVITSQLLSGYAMDAARFGSTQHLARIKRPGCGSNHTHFHLVQRLRMGGATHLLPIYALTV